MTRHHPGLHHGGRTPRQWQQNSSTSLGRWLAPSTMTTAAAPWPPVGGGRPPVGGSGKRPPPAAAPWPPVGRVRPPVGGSEERPLPTLTLRVQPDLGHLRLSRMTRSAGASTGRVLQDAGGADVPEGELVPFEVPQVLAVVATL